MAKEKRNLFFKLTALAIFVLALASTGYAFAYTGPGALTAGSGAGLMSVSGSNIGIGSASPILPLQVKDNATAYPYQAAQFTTTDWTTTVGSTFQIGHGASTGNTFSELRALTSGYNAWGNLIMQVGGGRVGIGTSTPAYTLDVNGNVRATAFVGALSGSMAADNVSSGSFGSLQGGGSYTFPASLGVGTTTTPGNRLSVVTPFAADDTLPALGANGGKLGLFNTVLSGGMYGLLEGVLSTGNAFLQVQRIDGTATAYNLLLQPTAGYVGIGTIAPQAKLHVADGSLSAGGGGDVLIGRFSSSYPSTVTNGYFKLSTNNADASNGGLTINYLNANTYQPGLSLVASGNVGVGTTTPAQKLSVVGTIESTTGGFKFPDGTIQTTAGGGGGGQWTTSSTSIYYNGGNVGIGTSAPSQKLEVSGSVKATAFIGTLSGSVAADNVSSGSFGSLQGGGVYTFPASVGIGTTTVPSERLEVTGKLKITNSFSTTNAALVYKNDTDYLFLGPQSGSSVNGAYFSLAGSTNGDASAGSGGIAFGVTGVAPAMVIKATTGNVGIGTTTPASTLDIFGSNLSGIKYTRTVEDARIQLGSPAQMWSLASGWNNAPGNLNILQEGVASRLTIASSTGNVGLGTITPTQRLDVNGTVALYGKVAFEGADTWLRINQSSTFTSGTYFGSNIIRTDGQLQVGPSGATFLVGTNGNVGINTTAPVDKLQVAGGYVSDLTGRLARNLLDTNTWTISSGSIGGWFANDSVAGESQRLWNNDPFGNPALLWRGVTNAANDASGGWNYFGIPVTDTKAYRSSVWFRMNPGAAGNLYLGLDTGNTNNLDGTANANPYFHAITWANFVPGRWYLFVGYIHASNDPSTTSYSAVYDGVTGQKVFTGTDYKNKPGITTQAQRTYSYYNTAAGTTVDMWGPRFEQMDGSEPSVGALLGGTGSSANPMYVNGNCTGGVTINWALGSTQHCTMTGPVTFTFTNGISGGNYRLVLLQDATGGRTASWPASVRWGSMGVPALTATPSKTDYIGFLYNGVSGAYDGIAFNSNF